MIPPLGQFLLYAAGAAAAGALGCCVLALARVRGVLWLRLARLWLIGACTGMLGAAGVLIAALLLHDFSIQYVADHTDRTVSPVLKIAAMWAGEEGGLLLWASMAAAVGAAVAAARRHIVHRGEAATLGLLACVDLFFAAILILIADPFRVALPAPADGLGLHPQLRHWAMVLHPPLLFLGSALWAAPFAIICGVLAAGRSDTHWLPQIRHWALAAWLSLGCGIVLGAVWAYREMGWGGYWGWDPVENASLMPWLTGTAFLHAVIVHQHRGQLKWWTACLGAATFVLPIVGAAITRSSLAPSVHTFGGSATGGAFALFGLALAVGAGALLFTRRKLMAVPAEIGSLASREGATLLGGITASVMAAAIMGGTLVPVISGLAGTSQVGVGPSFYARAVGPLAIVLVFLMSVSPLLVYGGAGLPCQWAYLLAASATAAAVAGLGAGISSPAVLLCVALLALTVAASGADLVARVRGFARTSGYGLAQAAARVIDGNHRRYGGQLAHTGGAILIVGIAGSSLLSHGRTATVSPGQSMTVGTRVLRLDSLEQVRGADYTAGEAVITEVRPGGAVAELRPQRRYYDRFGDAPPRAAVSRGWGSDLCVRLVGWEAGGRAAILEARVSPLMVWVWIGAGVMGLAGVFCLLPRLIPRPVPAATVVDGAAGRVAPAVVARGVSVQIEGRTVLDGINLELGPGTLTAVLGPNGSGKTTFLRLLATLRRPATGTLEVLGECKRGAQAARPRIGFVGYQLMLYRDLSALQNIEFFARLHGVPDPRRRAREMLDLVGLSGLADTAVRSLSRGQAQRVAIARALAHRPALLLMDEPFTGLDAEWAPALRDHLCLLRQRGCTIVLSHHDPRDLPGFATRVLVLRAGRIATDLGEADLRPASIALSTGGTR